MINVLTNRHDPSKIGSLTIEVVSDENHEYKNDVLMYPIEEGFDISDHIHQQPESYTITGIISDTPLPQNTGDLTEFIKGMGENRTQRALEELLAIIGRSLPKQEKELGTEERDINSIDTLVTPERTVSPKIVDIVSGLRVYTNMICTSLTFPRNVRIGRSLRFSASFRKIYTVKSSIVDIDKTSDLNGKAPRIDDQAPKTKDTGVQTTKQPKSILSNIWDGIRGK